MNKRVVTGRWVFLAWVMVVAGIGVQADDLAGSPNGVRAKHATSGGGSVRACWRGGRPSGHWESSDRVWQPGAAVQRQRRSSKPWTARSRCVLFCEGPAPAGGPNCPPTGQSIGLLHGFSLLVLVLCASRCTFRPDPVGGAVATAQRGDRACDFGRGFSVQQCLVIRENGLCATPAWLTFDVRQNRKY